MQELLGRITRLDPEASLALRVIACFDELVVGNVNTRGLLAAAASLAGCTAGFGQRRPARTMRIDPRGDVAPPDGQPAGHAPQGARITAVNDDIDVWLERTGPPEANDAIIAERLALAVRSRHARGPGDGESRRHLAVLVDGQLPVRERTTAAAALGLVGARYRVVTAPLFAVWRAHPGGPEDVVATAYGPLHTVVVPGAVDVVEAGPSGVGVSTGIEHLDHSFRTSMVALRLSDRAARTSTAADSYPGLISMFADEATNAHHPDADSIAAIAAQTWGAVTLDALVKNGSVRQAARELGVHHSTLQTRLEAITAALGFDPLDGFGRIRTGVAYLAWRLQHSQVLDLPAPAGT